MRAVLTALLSALFGAVIVSLGAFVWQAFLLIRSGVSRSSMSLEALTIDVMQLHIYAMAGALAGLILGVFGAYRAISKDRAFRRRMEALRSVPEDPDALIKRRRAQQAEEYLASRRDDEAGRAPTTAR